MGLPRILIFGESGGTSSPSIQRSGIDNCDLVAERERKDGRVVYCVGLENRSTERYRGFESLSFRLNKSGVTREGAPNVFREG